MILLHFGIQKGDTLRPDILREAPWRTVLSA